MKHNRFPRISIALLFLLFVPGALPAAAESAPPEGWPAWEVGFLAGAGLSDGDLEGGEYGLGAIGPVAGVRGAWLFQHRWNWFADAVGARYPTDLTTGKAVRFAVRSGVEYLLGPEGRGTWFLSGAAGWAKVDFAADTLDVSRPLGGLGIGQRFRLRNGTIFRWELRGECLFGNSDLSGKSLENGELLVGWAIPSRRSGAAASAAKSTKPPVEPTAPTSAKPPVPETVTPKATTKPKHHGNDADGDGVPDKDDRCAFTPEGYPVDARGCAIDSDGDQVPDGADRCLGTPKGAWVDAKGCPADFDHDGVVEGIDRCPDTPAGTKVDERGCPVENPPR